VPLAEAARAGEVLPLFVLDPYFLAPERARETPYRVQFLLESLQSLAANLERSGSRLLLVAGKSVDVVPKLVRKWNVDRVVAQGWCAPFARQRDRRIARALKVPFDLFEGETLRPAGSLRTGDGNPYSVFSAFARAFIKDLHIAHPLPAPRRLPQVPDSFESSASLPALAELGIEGNPAILSGGERAARERLKNFLEGPGASYETLRNQLGHEGTSRLSADLKFGTLSVRTVWRAAEMALAAGAPAAWRAFSNELIWREFTHSTLWDHPELMEHPFRPAWEHFPYRKEEAGWKAWVKGKTGYPVVDAAARQLIGEGFVHNRARMIAASFLTKHLLIDYRRGEQYYRALLTDGDWAQNVAGWQWTAGCGTDAQPYFRVFNPVSQGEKFDPDGKYVRRWLPELARLPDVYIHRPWEASKEVLSRAGVVLDETYPSPIVEHGAARERFLNAAKAHLGGTKE
jgi:deoxyribodipyrimidine photo-lyase